jgi:hypothetical protein
MIENFLARAVQFPGIATRYDWVGGVLWRRSVWAVSASGIQRDDPAQWRIIVSLRAKRSNLGVGMQLHRDCFVASLLPRET